MVLGSQAHFQVDMAVGLLDRTDLDQVQEEANLLLILYPAAAAVAAILLVELAWAQFLIQQEGMDQDMGQEDQADQVLDRVLDQVPDQVDRATLVLVLAVHSPPQ